MDGHFNVPTFPHCRHRIFSPLWLTEKSCRKVSSRLYLKGAECLVFQNYRELRGSFLWLAGDSESFIYWLPRGPHSSQSVWSGDLKIKHVPRVFVAGCKNSPSLLTREHRLVDTVYEPARVCARACAPWTHHHMLSNPKRITVSATAPTLKRGFTLCDWRWLRFSLCVIWALSVTPEKWRVNKSSTFSCSDSKSSEPDGYHFTHIHAQHFRLLLYVKSPSPCSRADKVVVSAVSWKWLIQIN